MTGRLRWFAVSDRIRGFDSSKRVRGLAVSSRLRGVAGTSGSADQGATPRGLDAGPRGPVVTSRSTWWLLTGFTLVSALFTIPALVHDHRPAPVRAVGVVALAVAMAGWLAESRRYRSRWYAVVAEAAAIMLAAVALPVPDIAKGLLFAVVARRGVCANSRISVALAVVANSTTFTIAVFFSRFVFDDYRPLVQIFSSSPGLVVTPLAMRMLVEQLSARAAAERTIARTSGALHAVVETCPVGLLLLDADGVVRMCNTATGQIFGFQPEELLDRPVGGAADDGENSGAILPAVALAGRPLTDHEIIGWRRRDGGEVDLTISTAPLPDLAGAVAVVSDVTERRRMQNLLRRQALHDDLTGLANRTLFLEKATWLLAASAGNDEPIAVLLLDLDAFKTVNDTLGHATGDALLIEVAGRLKACLRPQDTLARLGGDEFAVLLRDCREDAAIAVARRVIASLDGPIRLAPDGEATTEVRVRVSVGAVLANKPPMADANGLLRAADLAMYAAKRAGGHRWAVFEPAMADQLRERVSLENDLRRALLVDELALHYQPCVDLATGRVTAAEALLRWNNHGRGVIDPKRFVPIAEDTGMIIPIGRWALAEACRQTAEWQRLTGRALNIAVNLSVRQLADPNLADDIESALKTAELPPARLVLELTESELADHTALPVLRGLKGLGVRLALDDFGTGYSSLAYLRRFPLDVLKIDRAFVAPITTDPSAEALTRSIINMASTLGLDTVAEGVETAEQATLLRRMRCKFAQGYHFATPRPASEVTADLRANGDGGDA